jgi:hypothetical protein
MEVAGGGKRIGGRCGGSECVAVAVVVLWYSGKTS